MRFCPLQSKNAFVLVLAHLELELELFGVDDIGDDGHLSPKLQTALAGVLNGHHGRNSRHGRHGHHGHHGCHGPQNRQDILDRQN